MDEEELELGESPEVLLCLSPAAAVEAPALALGGSDDNEHGRQLHLSNKRSLTQRVKDKIRRSVKRIKKDKPTVAVDEPDKHLSAAEEERPRPSSGEPTGVKQ